jgi:hypothetical protein
LEKGQTQALSTALAAGAFTWSFLYEVGVGSAEKGLFWLEGGGLLSAPFLLGLGVAAAVFLYMNEKVKVKVVTFECLPWQAPSGGENCELCNDDDLPCSEYRCRSLGQNCEVVNPGTEQEKCVNVNPRDVNPPVITPDENELSAGHKYTNVKSSPPEPGFEIVNLNSADGCLKAFSPLKFGITVDEPSQCKIDFNHTTKFDEMRSYFGGSNYYLYNHTEQFVLPSAAAFKNSSLVLRNGKELEFFVRCKDKNGNENSAEYAVRFCIDPSPDTTAPKISATSIENGACVAENQNSANVDFYTNEPSECRWSTTDQSYENMQNDMTCLNELYQLNGAQLFTCSANLTGIAKDNTNFYVRCKDQPGEEENNRNENAESYEFSLRGSSGLKMKTLRPNGTIFGGVDPAPIEIYAETQYGCNEGRSVCFYSASGDERDRVMFFDTNNEDGISTQRQDLSAGEHEYLIQCVDAGGNVAEDKLKFKLDIDTSAPVVARAYEEDGMLKIVTVRKSECAYTTKSCDFTFKEGTEMPYANTTVHVTEWNNKNTYYIKCKDEFRNEEASCSIIVKPSSNFL